MITGPGADVGKLLVKHRKNTDCDRDIMDEGYDGTHGVFQLENPEEDKGDDKGRRHEDGDADIKNREKINSTHKGGGHDAAQHPF